MLGTRLKRGRLELRISQRTAAVLVGVSQPVFGLFELGRLTPRPGELRRLSALFGIPPDELFDLVEIPNPPPPPHHRVPFSERDVFMLSEAERR